MSSPETPQEPVRASPPKNVDATTALESGELPGPSEELSDLIDVIAEAPELLNEMRLVEEAPALLAPQLASCLVASQALPPSMPSNDELPFEDSSDVPECRFCRTHTAEELVSPCLCRGSIQFIHPTCIRRWMITSGTRSCELCQYSYKVEERRPGVGRFVLSLLVHSVASSAAGFSALCHRRSQREHWISCRSLGWYFEVRLQALLLIVAFWIATTTNMFVPFFAYFTATQLGWFSYLVYRRSRVPTDFSRNLTACCHMPVKVLEFAVFQFTAFVLDIVQWCRIDTIKDPDAPPLLITMTFECAAMFCFIIAWYASRVIWHSYEAWSRRHAQLVFSAPTDDQPVSSPTITTFSSCTQLFSSTTMQDRPRDAEQTSTPSQGVMASLRRITRDAMATYEVVSIDEDIAAQPAQELLTFELRQIAVS
jgi:hypothetical protein